MAISSSNRFFVALLALLCLTGAHARRALVESNSGEKNGDLLNKALEVEQKCSSCAGRGESNCCPGHFPGQCQSSCSGCVGSSSGGFVGFVPVFQTPCGCFQLNPGFGCSYGAGKWKGKDGAHTDGAHIDEAHSQVMTHIHLDSMNSGLHNEPVKPMAEMGTHTKPSHVAKPPMTEQ